MAAVTGTLAGRLPFVRIGTGGPPLVVLPGLALTHDVPRGLTLAAYAQGFRRLAQHHTVHIVSRPAGPAAGASTADIAAAYAAVLRAELGIYRLMGLSTGGLIAQHVALDHSSDVERLVLVVTGARLAPAGRAICERWLELARAGRWRELSGDLAAVAVDGRAVQALARFVGSGTGRRPTGQEAADFAVTVSAVLAHDTSARLAGLATPTLVVGGARDPFFPEASLRATAGAIPRAELRVFARQGHGVPKHRAGALQDAVSAFL